MKNCNDCRWAHTNSKINIKILWQRTQIAKTARCAQNTTRTPNRLVVDSGDGILDFVPGGKRT